MTAPFRIGAQNGVVFGTVAASSSASGFPVTAIQSQSGSQLHGWQTATDSGEWLRCDLGASYAIGAFGIFRTNLTSAGTIRARIFSDSGYSAVIYDSGTISANVMFNQSIIIGGVTGRYVQMDFNDASNPDNCLKIPLAYIGPLLSFQVGYSSQSKLSSSTGNVTLTTKEGVSTVSQYWTARQWSVSLTGVLLSEWTSLQDFDMRGRRGENGLFIPDISSTNINREAIFGPASFSSGIGFSAMSADMRSGTFNITERL